MAWKENGELSGSDRQALVRALQRFEADGTGDELLRLDQGDIDASS
ncbi:hypothetical protein [Parasynechococcus sp.]